LIDPDKDVDGLTPVNAGLLALGLAKGERVGIWSPNCAEWVFVQYATAKIGEELEAVADVRSTVAQPATVRLYADGIQVAEKAVDLQPGSNRVAFLVKPTEAGFHTFRAVVEAGRDTFAQNNRADSDTIVNGEPRVLVLAGDEKVAKELVGALETEHQKVDTKIPEQLPSGIEGLLSYDSIVLVDVSRLRLSDAQLSGLQQYVRDFGRGLVSTPSDFGKQGRRPTHPELLDHHPLVGRL